jgi:hypothetical protein
VYPEGYTIFCRDYWRNLWLFSHVRA